MVSTVSYVSVARLNRGSGPAPPAAVEAGRILNNVRAQQSVHYVSWESMGAGARLMTSADVANGRGVLRQTLRRYAPNGAKPYRWTIVVTGATVYVRAPASSIKWLLQPLNTEARRYAGRWISIPRGSRFGYLATGGTLESLLRQIAPHGRLATSASIRKDGQRVIRITGTRPWGQTFLTARSSSLLPVSAGYVAGGQGRTRFSRWNEPVHVKAPAHSISIDALRHR